MKDLIERLRIVAKYHRTDRQASDDAVILEAADAIERLSVASNEEFPALVLSVALSATDMQVIHTYLGAHAIQAQAPLKAENAQLKAELAAMRDQKPVGEVYTMEALASGGYVRHHASLTKSLPAGTKLYAAPIAEIEARWIPVTERLPKAYDEVLVWPIPSNNSRTAEINTIGTWRYGEYELNFGWTENVCDVTHWMPLPTPPGAKP